MAENLVIRITGPQVATWTVVDSQGRRTGPILQGPLSAAGEHATGRRVVALVPGNDVLLASTQLPVRGHAKQLKMVPYSLEEGLATDVEKLSFAIGDRDSEGNIPVAVVDRSVMHGWLDGLAAEGIRPDGVYSDAEGVPDTPGTVTLLVEHDRTYLRKPGEPPVAFDGIGVDQVVDLALDADELGRVHMLVYAEQDQADRFAEFWPALRERLASLDVQVLAEGALPRMSATLLGGGEGINLLQGPLAPQSDWLALARPWQLAASLLLGLLLVTAAAEGLEYLVLKRKSDALETTLSSVCQRVFPGASQRDCGNRARQALSDSGASGPTSPGQPFLPTLALVGEALGKARLQALDYRSGVMNLRVLAPDVSTLDQIQRGIAGGGVEVNIQSANPVDGGVEGRLQIRSSGG